MSMLVLSALSSLLALSGVATQTAVPAVSSSASAETVPMHAEPYHRLVFEHPQVAVYDVRLPVGATMKFHAHPTNHLAVVIEPGRMQNEVLGRPGKENPTGVAGTLVYVSAGPPHRQTNIDRQPIRFIAIEVLRAGRDGGATSGRASQGDASGGAGRTPPSSPAPPPAGTPVRPHDGAEQRAAPDGATGCRVEIDEVDVRGWRCRLMPGQSIPARPDAGPAVRIGLSAGRLEQTGPAPTSATPATSGTSRTSARTETLVPGGATWLTTSGHAMKNAGAAPLDFIEIEWK